MLIHSPQPWSDFRGGDYAELIAYCQDKDILGPGAGGFGRRGPRSQPTDARTATSARMAS